MTLIGEVFIGVAVVAVALLAWRWFFSTPVVLVEPARPVPAPLRSSQVPSYLRSVPPSQRVFFDHGGSRYYYQGGHFYDALGGIVVGALLTTLAYEMYSMSRDDVEFGSGNYPVPNYGSTSYGGDSYVGGASTTASDAPVVDAPITGVERFADADSRQDEQPQRFTSRDDTDSTPARFTRNDDDDDSSSRVNRFGSGGSDSGVSRFDSGGSDSGVSRFDSSSSDSGSSDSGSSDSGGGGSDDS
jgi:hypothetical protein